MAKPTRPTDPCEPFRQQLPELIRGEDASAQALAHAEACEDCAALLERTRELAGWFAAPEEVDPPGDLLLRTFDRCLAPAEPGALGARIDARPAGAMRSSLHVLTRPIEGGGEPTRRRLVLRAVVQALAACLLFLASGVFSITYFSAYAEARDSKAVSECQVRLRLMWSAAMVYRQSHPEGPTLRGKDLQRALIESGALKPADFYCPGRRVHDPRDLHYSGFLSGGDARGFKALFWDRMSNHAGRLNVIGADADGKVATISDDQLFERFLRPMRREEPGSGPR